MISAEAMEVTEQTYQKHWVKATRFPVCRRLQYLILFYLYSHLWS